MRLLFTILAVTVLTSGLAFAQAPEKTVTSATAKIQNPQDNRKASDLAQRRALHADLQAAIEREKQEVAAIVAQIEAAVSFDERYELELLTSRIKNEGVLERLNIQLVHAERYGFQDQARSLQGEIDHHLEREAVAEKARNSRSTRPQVKAGSEVR